MKKIIPVLTLAAVLLGMAGCTSSANSSKSDSNGTSQSSPQTVDVMAQLKTYASAEELIASSDRIVVATVVAAPHEDSGTMSSEENKDGAVSAASENSYSAVYGFESTMNFKGDETVEFEVTVTDENVKFENAASYILFLDGAGSPYTLVSAYHAQADKNGAYQPVDGIDAPAITLDSLMQPSQTTTSAVVTTTTMK